MIINKCTCGCEELKVKEDMTWDAVVMNDILECSSATSRITSIECANCGKKYTRKDFSDINFS